MIQDNMNVINGPKSVILNNSKIKISTQDELRAERMVCRYHSQSGIDHTQLQEGWENDFYIVLAVITWLKDTQ